MFSYREPMGYRIKHALYMYFEEVRQVVVPLGRQTTITLFGRVNQNVASGLVSTISLLFLAFGSTRVVQFCVQISRSKSREFTAFGWVAQW